MITIDDFKKVDIRVGKIIDCSYIENAKHSTHKLTIDIGEMGTKISCARLVNYTKEELVGRLVLCVVNFAPRQIGKNVSEVLTLGVPDGKDECVLVVPERDAQIGSRLY